MFEVAANVNGVQYTASSSIATPIPQGSATASGTSASTTSTSLNAAGSLRIGRGQLMGPLGFAVSMIVGALSIL